jgi:hypothetical protein
LAQRCAGGNLYRRFYATGGQHGAVTASHAKKSSLVAFYTRRCVSAKRINLDVDQAALPGCVLRFIGIGMRLQTLMPQMPLMKKITSKEL